MPGEAKEVLHVEHVRDTGYGMFSNVLRSKYDEEAEAAEVTASEDAIHAMRLPQVRPTCHQWSPSYRLIHTNILFVTDAQTIANNGLTKLHIFV